MLGHASISETSFGDVGGVLLVATAEMSGVASKTSVGVGILGGIASMDTNFTATTDGIFITGSVNAELSSNFTQTTENIKVVNFTDAVLSSAFTQSANSIMIGSGVATTDFNMTQTSTGDLLYENINASATEETYTTITPSGTESWTTVNPSGTETWTEI